MSEDQKQGQIKAIEETISGLESQTTTLNLTIKQLMATVASLRETLEAVQATLRETRKELELVKAEEPVVVPEITDEEMAPLEEAIDEFNSRRSSLEEAIDDYNMFLERLQERWGVIEDSASSYNDARDEVESKLEPIQAKLTDFVCGVPEGWLESDQGKAFAAYRGRFDVEIPEEADIAEPTAIEYIDSSDVESYEFDDRHDIDLPEHVLPEILQKKEVEEDLEESVEEEAARLTDCD